MSEPTAGRRTLNLASFNTLSGRRVPDGRFDAEAFREAIRALDELAGGLDVLALQEVERQQPRTASADLPALAAQALGDGQVTVRYVPTVAGTPGMPGWTPMHHEDGQDLTVPDGPSYGLALLSRRPVVQWRVLTMRPPRGRWPVAVPANPPLLWIADEPRVAVAAVLQDPQVTVCATHLSFVPGVNVRQLRQLTRWLRQLPQPVLLMGDLNLPGAMPRLVTGWTPLVEGPTYPSPHPRLQLDHVLASRLPSDVTTTGRVLVSAISDHRPVAVSFTG